MSRGRSVPHSNPTRVVRRRTRAVAGTSMRAHRERPPRLPLDVARSDANPCGQCAPSPPHPFPVAALFSCTFDDPSIGTYDAPGGGASRDHLRSRGAYESFSVQAARKTLHPFGGLG